MGVGVSSTVPWKVHKFGGTSVLNAARYRNVGSILHARGEPRQVVVVSAMKGVTDDLINCVHLAKAQDEIYLSRLNKVHERHNTEVHELLGEAHAAVLRKTFERDFKEVAEILRGVFLTRNFSDKTLDFISGLGEVWSAQILHAYLTKEGQICSWLDARRVLVVRHEDQRVVIDWTTSKANLNEFLTESPADLIVVSGFVARLADGTATTLGRNGSDYSASIFGALFEGDEVFIWTDVDGVLSADPRQVPEAVVLSEMSYSEVTELAYFGAKVVHPATMAPAIARNIPIWIKNTFNPTFAGTKVHADAKGERDVKGFSTIDKICLLNLEGSGMVGVPGVAERLFAALRAAGVNVVLISQASSEHSICVAIHEEQGELARQALAQTFFAEIQLGLIQPVEVRTGVSILAAVGDQMARVPGVAGRFFAALGRSGVNVIAIAQGSSERNISAVISKQDATRALRTVHSDFILPHQTLSLGILGTGLIGSTLLDQLNESSSALRGSRKIDFKVRGLANSKTMWLSTSEIDLSKWREDFAAQAEPFDLDRFIAHLRPNHIPHSVLIEATASSVFTSSYAAWLQQGLHIVSPNKKANTGSMAEYKKIRQASRETGRHFLYSTNVGAGLPILQTLRDLYATGDEIQQIQGILSGTLSFIFNQYDGETPFSECVKLAKQKGFTEPDPRDDLSGQDVVRKLVILGREIGLTLELADVRVEGLVPATMASLSTEEFLQLLPQLDEDFKKRYQTAKANHCVLRFVASIDQSGRARVGLESLPKDHAFAHVQGTDNIVLFKTKRYSDRPLVVQGPGAGPEVTAAGVFADLLRLSQYLGDAR